MDNFGIVVLICSLSPATESRSGPLLLLLAVIDFSYASDMQMASRSKKSIFRGVQGPQNLSIALKIEAA